MDEKQEQLLALISNEVNTLEYIMYSLLSKASNQKSDKDLKNLQFVITQITEQQRVLVTLMGGNN